jgi:response regulator NasT
MLASTATPHALHSTVQSERPDVIIIDTDSPSRDTLEQLAVMNATAPRPVLMFSHDANQQLIRDAVGAGVTAYLVEGLETGRLAPILEVALARFAQESQLRERLAQVENELAERKLIDRAKRLLMDQQKLTEHAAYAMLRKRAMNQGVKLAEVARAVVAAAEQPK